MELLLFLLLSLFFFSLLFFGSVVLFLQGNNRHADHPHHKPTFGLIKHQASSQLPEAILWDLFSSSMLIFLISSIFLILISLILVLVLVLHGDNGLRDGEREDLDPGRDRVEALAAVGQLPRRPEHELLERFGKPGGLVNKELLGDLAGH